MRTAEIVSSAIAAISVLISVLLALLLRNKRSKLSRDAEMRSRLSDLKNELDSTSLITTSPHYEMWSYGFVRLEKLREMAVKCYGLIEVAPDGSVPREVKNAVRQTVDDIKNIYQYRDSYDRFSKGKLIRSQEQIESWLDFERAKHSLTILQTDYRKNISTIEAHLTKLY